MNKFDEIEAKIGTYLKNNDLSNSDNNDNFFHIVLEDLRKEYSPTIEMTKTDKEMLLYYLENYSFYVFIDIVHTSKGNTFGLPANDDFNDLSDEEIMQAWLHPETIKVVDE